MQSYKRLFACAHLQLGGGLSQERREVVPPCRLGCALLPLRGQRRTQLLRLCLELASMLDLRPQTAGR